MNRQTLFEKQQLKLLSEILSELKEIKKVLK